MADFYLDENVSRKAADRLLELGHTVVRAQEMLHPGTKDHLQFAMSVRLLRVLITYNIDDFQLLHLAWCNWFAEWGTPPVPIHAGVLTIEQPPVLPAEEGADLVHAFTTSVGSEALSNRCFEWRAPHGWHEVE